LNPNRSETNTPAAIVVRSLASKRLDHPRLFTAPIFANLFGDEEADGYGLIWSRAHGAHARAVGPHRKGAPDLTPQGCADYFRHDGYAST